VEIDVHGVANANLRKIADVRTGYDGKRTAVVAPQCHLARGQVNGSDSCGRRHHA
jgi:hypothetical protein